MPTATPVENFRLHQMGNGRLFLLKLSDDNGTRIWEFSLSTKVLRETTFDKKRIHHQGAVASSLQSIYLSGSLLKNGRRVSQFNMATQKWSDLPMLNFKKTNHAMILFSAQYLYAVGDMEHVSM